MRSYIVALLAVTSGTAMAQKLSPIDASKVPGACSALAEVPGDAKIDRPSFEARISAAHCAASVKLQSLQGVNDDDAGMKTVMDAIAPSIAWLDDVIKTGEPQYGLIAESARAQLLVAAAVRMRNTIPPITMTTVGDALADHDKRHAALEPKIKPWLDNAAASFEHVRAAAAAKPELVGNPVIKAAVDAAAAPVARPATTPPAPDQKPTPDQKPAHEKKPPEKKPVEKKGAN